MDDVPTVVRRVPRIVRDYRSDAEMRAWDMYYAVAYRVLSRTIPSGADLREAAAKEADAALVLRRERSA